MTQVIRPAEKRDAYRIAEILVFNYRLNFYPVFRDDAFYFDEMQVKSVAEDYLTDGEALQNTYVYDDGAVKGMIQISGDELGQKAVELLLSENPCRRVYVNSKLLLRDTL